MNTQWQSTIYNAFTIPGLLHPLLEQTIPSLIKDEIQRLANLSLFQNNVQPNTTSSQVPVDMKITNDSLNIRLAKNAPWISLLPPTKGTMTPEERAVDAIRREIMERIALLQGSISSNPLTESNSSNGNTSGSFQEGMKTTHKTRSKRSRRNERNKRLGNDRRPPTHISGNKIDYSTHTTNNYYCCVGSHHEPSNPRGQNPGSPTTEAHTQTDPGFNPNFRNQSVPGNHREKNSSQDSLGDESKHSSSNSFTSQDQMRDRSLSSSDHSDAHELEDFSRDESEHNPTGSFSSKSSKGNSFSEDSGIEVSANSFGDESEHSSTHLLESAVPVAGEDWIPSIPSDGKESDANSPIPLLPRENIHESKEVILPSEQEDLISLSHSDAGSEYSVPNYLTATSEVFGNSDRSDLESELSYSTARNEEFDLGNSFSPKNKRELFRNPFHTESTIEPMPMLLPIPPKEADPFIEIKKFIETYDTASKSIKYRRAIIELQIELAQTKPNREKINNLLSLLQADSLQVAKENFISLSHSETGSEYDLPSYPTATSEAFGNSDRSDLESELSYSTAINDEADLGNSFSPKNKRELFKNLFHTESTIEPMPILLPTPPKEADPFKEIKKFIETYDTDSKSIQYRRAILELQIELTQTKPNREKINNLLSLLQADSLQVAIEASKPKVVRSRSAASSKRDLNNTTPTAVQITPASPVIIDPDRQTDFPTVSIGTERSLLEKGSGALISSEDIARLNTFINDSIEQTDAFIDIVNQSKEKIGPETMSFLVQNQRILRNLQDLLLFDPQLAIHNDRINPLLDQLDLTTLQWIHNNPELEIPFIGEDFDDASKISNPMTIKTRNTASTETEENDTIPKTTQTTPASPVIINQDTETDSSTVSGKDQYTSTEPPTTKDGFSHTIDKNLKTVSTETEATVTIPKTTQTTPISPVIINQDTQTDSSTVSVKDQYTHTEQPIKKDSFSHTIDKNLKTVSTETEHSSLEKDSGELVSSEDIARLNTFINDSIEQTDAFIDIANHSEEEIDPETISFLVQNQSILRNLQELLLSDPQSAVNNDRVNPLLDQLDLTTLQWIHNNPELEIPFISEDFDDSSTLVESVIHRFPPEKIHPSVQKDLPQPDEEVELLGKLQELLTRVERLHDNISLPIQKNPTAKASTQSDDYRTDKEIKLKKKVQLLSKKYKKLASRVLEQTKIEDKQRTDLSELQFQLQHTKNELANALRRFETLAESTETRFKIAEDQSEYIRDLERELEELQQLLSISTLNNRNPRVVLKEISTQTEKQEGTLQEDTLDEEIAKTTTSSTFDGVQETSPLIFDDLPPNIKKLFHLYEKVTYDLNEIKYSSNSQQFYEKYKKSNIIADLTNFAKKVVQIDPITDGTLPTQKEIDSVITQIKQLFLQEKELEDAELIELAEDFNQRLKLYNELTSDLQKFQNEQLTLAELYHKYAKVDTLSALEIFARQERDVPPSKASVEYKIKKLRDLLNLRDLLVTLEDDLQSTDL